MPLGPLFSSVWVMSLGFLRWVTSSFGRKVQKPEGWRSGPGLQRWGSRRSGRQTTPGPVFHEARSCSWHGYWRANSDTTRHLVSSVMIRVPITASQSWRPPCHGRKKARECESPFKTHHRLFWDTGSQLFSLRGQVYFVCFKNESTKKR